MAALPAEVGSLSHRLVSVPRLVDQLGVADKESPASDVRRRMLPAIAMVHASSQPVVCAWLRAQPNGRTAVLVGGVTAPTGADEVSIAFPAGARAIALSRGAADALARLDHWERADLALDCTGAGEQEQPGPLLEDLFALLPDRPMGVVTIGRPRSRPEVQPHLDELSDAIDALEQRRQGRGAERLRLARAEEELRYLERMAGQGHWEVEVWTGGASVADARAVAALIGGTGELADLPLQVRPAGATTGGAEESDWQPTRVVGADCVAALARPPSRELPGIRVADVPTFDLTPEVSGDLALGTVLDATRQPCMPFSVPLESVNRHVFVTGATGSGKSQSVRSLLGSLSAAGVPWLVIEPAKSEYARMAGRIRSHGPVVVIRPGLEGAPPASLNPMEPSSITVGGRRVHFPLQTHVDLVRALFTASFDADEPFPQILAAALSRSYEEQGWNLTLGRAIDGDPTATPRYPTLSDVQRQALAAVDAIGYGREVRDNVQGFVRVRIDSLRQGTPGRFFEGGHPLDLEALLATNAVFEIDDLGDDRDKAFFIGNVLIRLFEVLRLKEAHGQYTGGLAHVTVVEEAHRLLHNVEEGSASAQAVTMFANLLAEVRSYGEGIVVAEQIPAKIIPDVVKNSAVKVMHRLPAADDRAFVGATMNLTDEQSEVVVSLPPGVAATHVDGMDAPILVQVDGSGASLEGRAKAPPLAPIGRRSPTCPSSCTDAPCTLGELVVSQEAARAQLLTLWAEIVTVAHLMFEAPRRVGPDVLAGLHALDAERARCTLGLLVDAAVDRRSAAIRRFYDPALLKRRVVTVMREQWREGLDAPIPAPHWAIAGYRWTDALRALAADPQGADTTRPHPDSEEWAKRGLMAPGPSWDEQRRQVEEVSRPFTGQFASAFLGDPPVLHQLAQDLGTGDDPAARFDSALERAGLPQAWPLLRLGAHLPRIET